MPDSLQQLEQLRRDAVDRARAQLAQAQANERVARDAQREAEARLAACEAKLAAARSSFAAAASVSGLQHWATITHAHAAEREAARQRLAHVGELRERARAELARRERALQNAELARRALSRGIERRQRALALRSERRQDDDVEDHFRTHLRD